MMQSEHQAPPKLHHFPGEETLLPSLDMDVAVLGTLKMDSKLQRKISEFFLSADQIIFGQGKRRAGGR